MNKLQEIFTKPIFSFIGSFDKLPSTGNIGEVCIVDGKEYVYGFSWNELGHTAVNLVFDDIKIKDGVLYLT